LDRVERIVKVVGYVNVAPGFTDMPKVVNGESDLLVQLLGDRGQHARAAVGVASLSQDAPVETQSRWWLKSRRPHFLRRCSGHVFLAASRERRGQVATESIRNARFHDLIGLNPAQFSEKLEL
jgi:hypothetical protein